MVAQVGVVEFLGRLEGLPAEEQLVALGKRVVLLTLEAAVLLTAMLLLQSC